jgi:hypothetical protein
MSVLKWLRKTMRTSNGAAGGALGIFNELYNPSAHAAQIIVEEQKEAVKPKPSPEDKKKPGHQ